MKYLRILIIVFLMPLSSSLGETVKNELPCNFDQIVYEGLKSFAEVVHMTKTKYHEVINPQKALTNAINAYVSTLDPHSSFMDPSSYKEIIDSTQGKFFGIGVLIDNMKEPEQEFLKVIDTIPNGPADKAGIKNDDLIVQIGPDALKGMTTEEARAKLKGLRNTQVQVKVKRANYPELLTFSITRDLVQEQDALCYYFKDQGIYYLLLRMFTENSPKQLEQLLTKCHAQQQCKGIILDLRNNSGGLLTSVVDIAGLFLPKNSLVVSTKERDKKVEYKTTREPITLGNFPIFIIINNFTASAAEILAGTLQIHSDSQKAEKNSLVFLVGSKTFGKGSVQEVIPVCNDCAAKLTTSLYYLPNDISIQALGIKPDFAIEPRMPPTKDMQWFNQFFGYENSFKNAIKNKDSKEEKPAPKAETKEPSWQEKKMQQLGTDYTILSTVRLLEMLSMAQKAFPDQVATRQEAIKFLTKNYVVNDTLAMEEITI